MDEPRAKLALELLQEAVYRSRAKQAAGTSLFAAARPDRSGCGLGARAEVELELSEHGRVLFGQLFPSEITASEADRVRAELRAWVERQDELDRERNHFLKAFRGRHGIDRARYAPAALTEFESGLARVNELVAAERRAAAQRLLGTRTS